MASIQQKSRWQVRLPLALNRRAKKVVALYEKFERQLQDFVEHGPTFRFSLREVMLLTLVVALGIAWWLESRKARRLEIERVLLSRKERELQSVKFALESTQRVVAEYYRQGYHTLRSPDGRITIVVDSARARRQPDPGQ